MDIRAIFCERFNELLIEDDLTCLELAARIGADVSSVQKWKRGTVLPSLRYATAIADVMSCSLAYLFGRTEEKLTFSPRPCEDFYIRLRSVMREKGITRYAVTKGSRFKESYFTNWAGGKQPGIATLIELADILQVSIDTLVGRE